jgi:hypothetical protein
MIFLENFISTKSEIFYGMLFSAETDDCEIVISNFNSNYWDIFHYW